MNSSPPRRATVSLSRRQARKRRATCDQQLVACRVAEAIVDDLEAIQIHEQHGQLLAVPLLTGNGVADAVQEQRAVRQPGQRIVERALSELLLQHFALGGAAQRAVGVVDELTRPTLLEGPEARSVYAAAYQAHHRLLGTVVEGESERGPGIHRRRPFALGGLPLSSFEYVVENSGRSDTRRCILQDSGPTVDAAAPQSGGISMQQTRGVPVDRAEDVVDGRGGGDVAGEVGQALAETSLVLGALAEHGGVERAARLVASICIASA